MGLKGLCICPHHRQFIFQSSVWAWHIESSLSRETKVTRQPEDIYDGIWLVHMSRTEPEWIAHKGALWDFGVSFMS